MGRGCLKPACVRAQEERDVTRPLPCSEVKGMRDGGVSPEGSGDRVSLLLSSESDMGTLVTTVEGWCAGREGLQTAERGGLGTRKIPLTLP